MSSFRLQISSEGESISFGKRILNEIGRDILAIKIALGLIITADGTISSPENLAPDSSAIPFDDQDWFDCATGLPVDMISASTFNKSLESALMKYQLENQFLIICYLFEKYGVKNLIGQTREVKGEDVGYEPGTDVGEYSSAIGRQIEAAAILFDEEFSTLGEATLAVMHGWLPHSSFSNSGFFHSATTYREYVIDILPEVIYKDLIHRKYSQTIEDLVSAGHMSMHLEDGTLSFGEGPERREKLEEYKSNVSALRDWFDYDRSDLAPEFHYGYIQYIPITSGSSILYRASLQVMALPGFEDPTGAMMPPDERRQHLQRMLYPDPFINPDPFFIGTYEIGYFYETEFVLSPEGPLPTNDPAVLRDLEEKALLKVLEFYQKPDVWWYDTKDEFFSIPYFQGESIPRPSHPGLAYPPLDFITHERRLENPTYVIENALLRDQRKILKEAREALEDATFDWTFDRSPRDVRDDAKRKIAEIEARIASIDFTSLKSSNYWVVSTPSAIQRMPVTDPAMAQSWRSLDEHSPSEPLIKFVEYRTPPLRPGVRYRAFFKINKEKLDTITEANGSALGAQAASGFYSPITEAPEPDENELCAPPDRAESLRTYQEFQAHARKKRNEYARKLKEASNQAALSASRGRNVDLGKFGPFDLNAAFPTLSGLNGAANDYAYTQGAISGFTNFTGLNELPTWFGSDVSDSDVSVLNNAANTIGAKRKLGRQGPLKIFLSYGNLQKRVKTVAADLRKAGGILKSENISFAPGSNFKAEVEASELESWLTSLAPKLGAEARPELVEKSDILTLHFKKQEKPPKIGPKVGTTLTQITCTEKGVDIKFTGGRPRTDNYLNLIMEMTKGTFMNQLVSGLSDYDKPVQSYFDVGRKSCADLGLGYLEKGLALNLVRNFTSGIKQNAKKKSSTWEAFKDWGDEQFIDPAKKWAETSKKNWEDSWDDTYDESAALRSLGRLCTREQLYKEFFDKMDLPAMFCDYLKCIKLPGFELKLPSFHLPPLPKIPILGFYKALLESIEKLAEEAITRVLCTLVRTIIDKLSIPWCEDQLQEFIAAGSSATPLMNDALAAAFTNTGISSGKEEEAKQLFSDVSNMLTGQELCHLLTGRVLDDATMLVLKRLAVHNGLSGDLDSHEAIANFFGVLGVYLPSEVCDQLSNFTKPPGVATCQDTSDLMTALRARMQCDPDGVCSPEIEEVLAMAEKNMEDAKNALMAFSDSDISAALPEGLNIINPDGSFAQPLPDFIIKDLEIATNGIFANAKSSYVSALGEYIPAMNIPTLKTPKAGDDDYNWQDQLELEAATAQLEDYTTEMKRINTRADLATYRAMTIVEQEAERERLLQLASNADREADDRQEILDDRRRRYDSQRENMTATGDWAEHTGILDTKDKIIESYGSGFNNETWPLPGWLIPRGTTPERAVSIEGRKEALEEFWEESKPDYPSGHAAIRLFEPVGFLTIPDGYTGDEDLLFRGALRETVGANQNTIIDEIYWMNREMFFEGPFIFRWHPQWRRVAGVKPTANWEHGLEYFPPDDGRYDFEESILGRFQAWCADWNSRISSLHEEIFYFEIRSDLGLNPGALAGFVDLAIAAGYQIDPEWDAAAAAERSPAGNEEAFIALLRAEVERIQGELDLLEAAQVGAPVISRGAVFRLFQLYEIEQIEGTTHWVHKKFAIPNGASYEGERVYFETGPDLSPTGLIYATNADDLPPKSNMRELSNLASTPISYEDQLVRLRDPRDSTEFGYYAQPYPTAVGAGTVPIAGVLQGFMNSKPLAQWPWPLSDQRLYPMTSRPPNPCMTPEQQSIFSRLLEMNEVKRNQVLIREHISFIKEKAIHCVWGQKPPARLSEETVRGDLRANTDRDGRGDEQGFLFSIAGERLSYLSSRIVELMERRKNTFTGEHLPMVQELLSGDREEVRNFIDYNEDSSTLELRLDAGIFSPEIIMEELPSADNTDKYNIRIAGDYFLRQQRGSIDDDTPSMEFKFCDSLPRIHGESYQGSSGLSKRNKFANLYAQKMAEDFGPAALRARNTIQNDVYKETTESVMENIMFSLFDSDMFGEEYAQQLDARVGGKAVVTKECVTNRYSLSAASILSFEKIILDNPILEVQAEYLNPENNPVHRDFDDPDPFALAMQTVAMKGYVRTCLVDLLLKGGIAYATWDIEPIVGNKIFIDYAFEHVHREIKASNVLKGLWGPIIERAMKIANPKEALRVLVQSELLKLPNYSRQIFNPGEDVEDYYNWYFGNHIPNMEVSDIKYKVRGEHKYWRTSVSMPLRDAQKSFMIEHYVKFSGPLSEWARHDEAFRGSWEGRPFYWLEVLDERSEEQILPVSVFNDLLRDVRVYYGGRGVRDHIPALDNSNIRHGVRLVHISAEDSQNLQASHGEIHGLQLPNDDVISIGKQQKSYWMINISRGNPAGLIFCVPLQHFEREINSTTCPDALRRGFEEPFETIRVINELGRSFNEEEYDEWYNSDPGRHAQMLRDGEYTETLLEGAPRQLARFMIGELLKLDTTKLIFEHIFPVRRFMAISSIFTTSVLAGYNDLPTILDPTKNMLATAVLMAATSARHRDNIMGLDSGEFQKLLTEKFPGDPDDPACFEFPGLSKEFFEKFWKDLKKLIEMTPSILLRGIANQLDPAYKEMRAHYLNCDIDKLRNSALKFDTVDNSLVNGLYFPSHVNCKPLNAEGAHGQKLGKYAPIVPTGIPIDLVQSFANPFMLGIRLAKTSLKTVTYIYNGNAPFIDPAFLFKIPCLGIDENWQKGKKWDAGHYGRYGHPITPFTILALATKELESDKEKQKGNCKPIPEDC